MKTLLRLVKRLTTWINYPTSRERMWHMFYCGKVAGRKEALAELPITQVQPRQTTDPLRVNLPPGQWTRQWREANLTKYGVMPVELAKVPTVHDLTEGFPDWLNSSVIPKSDKDDTEGEATEHMPAIMKLKYATRKPG
jgi:hypothetical protein